MPKTIRRFLSESDLNGIAQRTSSGNADVFDLIFTVRQLRREFNHNPLDSLAMKTIVCGIQDTIRAHGPVTQEWVSSAAKRVYGRLRGLRLEQPST